MIDFIHNFFTHHETVLQGIPLIPFIFSTIAADQTILAADYVSTSAGAGDSGKVPKLNGSGQLDTSFLAWKGSIGSGRTTHDLSANGAQTIAHGLGVAPKLVKVTMLFINSNLLAESFSVYSGGTQSSLNRSKDTSTTDTYISDSAMGLIMTKITVTQDYNSYAITVDATNITLTWTKTASPTGTAEILWEALA